MRDQSGTKYSGTFRGGSSNTLLYILYGSGSHYDEAVFSVLSALHHIGADRERYRVVVYTDHPAPFAELPVHTHLVTADAIRDWSGPYHVRHRRKIFGIQDALRRFGGRVLYCDSDTYFTKHPKTAFRRIGPGATVMHIGEYRLADPCARGIARALIGEDFRSRAGQPWQIGLRSTMFNAGVVGVDAADAWVLDEVIHLCDQIDAVGARRPPPPLNEPLTNLHPEQFAFSVCLRRCTELRQSYDVVTHYWLPPPRTAFREHLIRVLHKSGIQPQEQQFRELAGHAPHLVVRPFQWGRENIGRRIRTQTWAFLGRMALVIGMKEPLKQALYRLATLVGFMDP